MGAWAKKDPTAALEWLQDNLQGGRTQAFSHLASSDPDQDTRFLNSLKQLPAPLRDPARRAIETVENGGSNFLERKQTALQALK